MKNLKLDGRIEEIRYWHIAELDIRDTIEIYRIEQSLQEHVREKKI